MKYIYITTISLLAIIFSSCSDFLDERSETTDTAATLTESPEGLDKMCVALYAHERTLSTDAAQILAANLWAERTTDLVVFCTGGDANLGWYKNPGPTSNISSSIYNPFWVNRYYMIGRANEIIHHGAKFGDDAKTQVAEGSFWRAYAHYQLWSRFGRLYLNTELITSENVNSIVATPAKEEDVFNLMLSDIDVAIAGLPVEINTGRVSRDAALHLKALIAAWKKDWDTVLDCVAKIEENGYHKMNTDPSKIFATRDYSKNTETLFSLNFSRDRGGRGHRLGSMHIARRFLIPYTHTLINGVMQKFNATNLGDNWGVALPNSYLMSRYTEGDKRLDVFFHRHITIENENELAKGLVLPPAELVTDKLSGKKYYTTSNMTGSPITLKKGDILKGRDVNLLDKFGKRDIRDVSISSIKHFDEEKPLASDGQTIAGKDIMVYRLAETYLLGAEAAVMLGKQDLAKTYYNKTWARAGNPAETKNITFDMVKDEQARELNFEGRRWEFLKRHGIWYDQVMKYAGDFTHTPTDKDGNIDTKIYNPATYGVTDGRDINFAPDPNYYIDFAGSNDHIATRINVRPHYENWPIPNAQIEAMGKENFPQTEGYNN